MTSRPLTILALVGAVLLSATAAVFAQTPDATPEERLLTTLRRLYPATTFTRVQSTPIPRSVRGRARQQRRLCRRRRPLLCVRAPVRSRHPARSDGGECARTGATARAGRFRRAAARRRDQDRARRRPSRARGIQRSGLSVLPGARRRARCPRRHHGLHLPAAARLVAPAGDEKAIAVWCAPIAPAPGARSCSSARRRPPRPARIRSSATWRSPRSSRCAAPRR